MWAHDARVTQVPDGVWSSDLESAYALFVADHVAKPKSRTLLETALEAMARRTDRPIEFPVFAERSEVVSYDDVGIAPDLPTSGEVAADFAAEHRRAQVAAIV